MASINARSAGTILRQILNALLVLFVVTGTNLNCLDADDWPQWRGPQRDGVSSERGLLTVWPTDGPKLAWKASGLGVGYASVIVGDGRLFTLGGQGSSISVLAFDALTGSPLWTRKIGESARNVNATPTLDGDRLYAIDPDGDLVCLRAATGDLIWQRRFVEDFDSKMMSGRGCGESPLIDGDRLICTPGNRDAALVALNKFTGDLIWKTRLPDLGPQGKEGAGFSSIVVTEAAGVRQYVQLVGRGLIGVEAATGRYLWGYNAIANENANIPTPVVHEDFVFAANGYTAGSVLLKLVRAADSTAGEPKINAEVVYSLSGSQFQNHHGGVIRLGDHVYAGHGNNNGLPTCLELETGRVVWKRRGPGVGSAAIVAVNGQLIFRYQNGLVALIDASPEGFKLNGTFEIPGSGGDSWSHPVVANGFLYLREQDTLFSYDLRRDPDSATVDPAVPTSSVSTEILGTLRQQGVIVGSIATAAERATIRPVFQFAHSSETDPLFLVSVTDKALTPEGLLSDTILAQLAQLKRPLIVNLEGSRITDSGLAQFQQLHVVGLNLELCGRLTDAGCAHLKQLKWLKSLILSGTSVSPAGVTHFSTSPTLIALELELCDAIHDDACPALGSMKTLRWLNLKKSGFEKRGISDTGLAQLQNLSQLETLNLYGNKVTDAGLVHLQSLKRLHELDLSLLDLNDAGIASLKPMLSLTRLNLMYTEGFAGPSLTDTSATTLEHLSQLTWLNLTGSKLSDAGLERLQSLKQLKTLQLIRTHVTAMGVERFQAALPECEIDR